MSLIEEAKVTRRGFLKAGGALVVVSATVPSAVTTALAKSVAQGPPWPNMPLTSLDSFLAIGSDGKVVGFAGKINAGMGVDTGFAQMLAEELYVAFDDVTIQLGDTATTPNQGGTGGSNGIQTAGATLRQAGAQAYQYLLGLASQRLNVPVAQLTVKNGVVSAQGSSQTVSYGDLIGGKQFNLTLATNPPFKAVSDYTIVGKPIKRREIPGIVSGQYEYIVDFKVPGMVHARVVRPPYAHATLVSATPPNTPGFLKLVTEGPYVAVIADTEWNAIKAMSATKVQWSAPAQKPFPDSYDALYSMMASATPTANHTALDVGDVDSALAAAARTVSGTYQSAFQSHACMGPGCAVADVSNGGATVWFGGQKPYSIRLAVADVLGIPAANVRAIWKPGPGSYGSNDADDVAVEAAWLSQQVGRPVRLQWMRNEGINWDPKAPPAVITLKAAIDGSGNVTGVDYDSREFSGTQRDPGATVKGDTLIGQLQGDRPPESNEFGISADNYTFPAYRRVGRILNWDAALGTGLRTAHMRDPNGPQTTFASESFFDEVAAALKKDPVQFRLEHLDPTAAARDIAVIKAVAKAAKWDTRPSPNNNQKGNVVRGRGIAYNPRGTTFVATVAEVEVNKKTGAVRVLNLWCAQDAGLIINPLLIQRTIEANLIQSASRALHEQVQFNASAITSVDWRSYPILKLTERPDLHVVLVNNPTLAPGGSGEPTSRPTAAALANAIFDATGWRVRRQPLTPQTVLAASH